MQQATTQEIAKTESPMIVNPDEFGIEHTKARAVQAYFTPMINAMARLEKRANWVNLLREKYGIESPRVVSLATYYHGKLVKARTGTAAIHKKAKAQNLAEGRFIDSHKNTQLLVGKPLEESLKLIKDHAENKERERIAKLRIQRITQLVNLGVEEKDIPDSVGIMPDSMWEPLVFGAQAKYDQKIAAEKAAAEAERLKKEAEEKERIEAEKAKAAEAERLRKEAAENKAKAEKLEAERKELLKKQEAEKAKADAERKALLDKQKAEREAAEAEAKKQAALIAEQNQKILDAKKAEAEAVEKARQAKADAEAAERKRVESENRANLVAQQSKERGIRITSEVPPQTLFPAIDNDKESLVALVAELKALKTKYTFSDQKYKSFYKRTGATIDRITSAAKFVENA